MTPSARLIGIHWDRENDVARSGGSGGVPGDDLSLIFGLCRPVYLFVDLPQLPGNSQPCALEERGQWAMHESQQRCTCSVSDSAGASGSEASETGWEAYENIPTLRWYSLYLGYLPREMASVSLVLARKRAVIPNEMSHE